MHNTSFPRRYLHSFIAITALLVCALQAHGTDTYDLGALQIPALAFGAATFSDVVLSVNLPPVSGPSGTAPDHTEDSYDPSTNVLTVPAVDFGNTTLYNVAVTVASVFSIGGVSGADTYTGTVLYIPAVQVGSTVYNNVEVSVSLANILRIYGGMPGVISDTPAFEIDQYNAGANELTIPAVSVVTTGGTKAYTNVVLHNVGINDVICVNCSQASSNYTLKVLYSFTGGTDGGSPQSNLLLDANGNLYGTTQGESGNSTVFKLTPNGMGGYTENVLHYFASGSGGVDGTLSNADLAMDASGNLYGTAQYGGLTNSGMVFELAASGGNYTDKALYEFPGGADGYIPLTGLTVDSSGNLLGTTAYGGTAGNGNVFSLAPNGTGGYAESVLYNFTGGMDGRYPLGGNLALDRSGNLYGTTQNGGTDGVGTVYMLTPNGSGGGSV